MADWKNLIRATMLAASAFLAGCATKDPSNLLGFLLSNRSPLFLSVASPAGPGNQGKAIEDQLILVINQSTSTLYCSFEDVNIPNVLEALHIAHLRGVDVKVGLEDDNKGVIGYRVLAGYLSTSGLNRKLWTGNAGAGQVYLNMCVADRLFTWLSTSPPTMQGIYSESAFSALIRTEEESMARKFAMQSDVITHGTFGSARQRVSQRNYWLVTGLNIGLYFSPEEDPVEGFLVTRLRSAASITGYSSEFLSNELDTNKVREPKDLAYEIKASPAGLKQIIGSYTADAALDNDEISKTNSLRYLRNNGVSAPVVAGGWPDNGLNFLILGRGTPSATAFISSHPYSSRADSSHDGFLLAFDHPSVVGQISGLYDELLRRSYESASSTAQDPSSPGGMEVVISEINWMGGYKAAGTTTGYEYVELYNNGSEPRNLSGWRFSCGANSAFSTVYTLPSGTLIGPKDYLLITGSSSSNTLVAQAHVKLNVSSSAISDTTTEQCRLTASNGTVVDTAGAVGVRFSANTEVFGLNDTTNKIRRSMERTDLTASGANTTNWHTNTTTSFATNYNIGKDFIDRTFGTPGLPNTAAGPRTFNVVLASATTNSTSVTVTFSEAPDSSASTAANYTVGVGSCASVLAVSAASVSGNTVTLTTAAQTAGTLYMVCASNIKSAAAGTSLTVNSATFYAYVIPCTNADVRITEFHAAPNTSTQDSNFDGTADSSADEFVEIKNISGTACGLVGFVITDKDSVRHTFGQGAALAAGQRYVIYGGGTPPSLGAASTDVANGGSGLGLNNGATDAVKICSASTGCASSTCTAAAPEIDCASWAPLADPDSDANRNSYGRGTGETGAFAFHNTLSAFERFSPGFAPGSMPPIVYQFSGSRTSPRSGSTVLTGTTIRIQFSTGMNSATLNNTNIKLFRDTIDSCSQNEVSLGVGTVTTTATGLTNDTVTFTPASTLDEPATYCVRITTGVQANTTNVAMLSDTVYEFYTQANPPPWPVRINEIGNAIGGVTANDFVEIYNAGAVDVDLGAGGYYLQRDSGCNLSNGVTDRIALSGTITAGGYFVIARSGSTLPNVNLYTLNSLGGGDCVILTNGNTAVTSATDGQVFDFAATSGAADTENGVTTPDISANNTAVGRAGDSADTNSNSADFAVRAATPGGQNGIPMFTSSPASGATSVALNANIVLTFNETMNTGVGTVNVVGSVSGAQNALTCAWSTTTNANDTCTINPPSDFSGAAETVTVTLVNLQNPSGSVPANTSFAFTSMDAANAPTVTNVVVASTNPNNGTTPYNTGTSTVTITGTKFTGVSCPSGVRLDDLNGAGSAVNTQASSCTVDSDTQITATFPAGIRTNGNTGWNVIVTNASGSNTTSTVKFIPKAGLVISEVYTGNATATYEFVEIYNPTLNSIRIDGTGIGLALHIRNSGGTDGNKTLTITGGRETIPSKGFLLITGSAVSATGQLVCGAFDAYTNRDATYTTGSGNTLVTNAGVYISLSSTANSLVIDKFGWGTQPSPGFEGTVFTPTISSGNSVERKPAGGSGATTDTDVNSADFNAESTSCTPKGTTNGTEP